MAPSDPATCRTCGKVEQLKGTSGASGAFTLSLCSKCTCVVYCSRSCQIDGWKEHKVFCKDIVATTKKMLNASEDQKKNLRERQRREGSSANDPRRMNAEAESLADLALTHKRSNRYDEAIYLYNQAIELDPFNHIYFYHRGECWMMVVQHFRRILDVVRLLDVVNSHMELAIIDSNTALRLCPSEGNTWLTLICASMNRNDFDSAQAWIDKALKVVPRNAEARPYILNYRKELKDERTKALPSQPAVISVYDKAESDKYFYLYTHGMHYQGRLPEILTMDLEMNRGMEHQEVIPRWAWTNIFSGVLAVKLGKVYEISSDNRETSCWVTPIPLTIFPVGKAKRLQKKLISLLLRNVQIGAGLVLLKVDYQYRNSDDDEVQRRPKPLSINQAKQYVQVIADRAEQVAVLYKRGTKMAPTF